MEQYRLEYSQDQGCFHLEHPVINSKNQNGFYCLADKISEYTAAKFINRVDEKYQNKPDFETIKNELEIFLLTSI